MLKSMVLKYRRSTQCGFCRLCRKRQHNIADAEQHRWYLELLYSPSSPELVLTVLLAAPEGDLPADCG